MKIIAPVFTLVTGVLLLFSALLTQQNMEFIVASGIIAIAGLIFLLHTMGNMSDVLKNITIVVGIVLIGVLVSFNYLSIKEPLDFQKEKDFKYAYVIQKLKDIRQVQKTYKLVKGKYAASFDSLYTFVQYDSVPFLKAMGSVPDSLTEEEALERGLVRREYYYEPVKSFLNDKEYLSSRDSLIDLSFNLDSISYIPFCGGKEFEIGAGEVVKNNVPVKVFEVIAYNKDLFPNWPERFYTNSNDLKVGSMLEPTINGNWE